MPRSDQYISHAWSIDGGEWKAPHPYVEGVRVTWRAPASTAAATSEPPTCTRCAYNPGWVPGGEPQDDDG